VPTLYFTNTQAASQLKGAEEVLQEFCQERLNCTNLVFAEVLRADSVVFVTTMLLAKREQEIHSKELSRRVLMGVLENIDK
jgi:hypothetical protein